jgi:hypothetical protein
MANSVVRGMVWERLDTTYKEKAGLDKQSAIQSYAGDAEEITARKER